MAEKQIKRISQKQVKKVNKKEKHRNRRRKIKAWLKTKMTKQWARRFSYQVFSFIVSVCMIAGVAIYAFNATYDQDDLTFSDNFAICVRTGAYKTKDDTIESVNSAIKNNAEVFQIDVRQRPNGTLVMSQDLLKTNSEGVELATVFQLIKPTDMKLDLEIKEIWSLSELYDMIMTYNMADRVFLTGIETYQVSKVKENCPNIDFYINYLPSRLKVFSDDYQQKILDVLQETGAVGINCRQELASRTLSNLLHKNGYKLSVYGTNWKFQMKRTLVNKPDNLITRHPDKIQEVINSWGN